MQEAEDIIALEARVRNFSREVVDTVRAVEKLKKKKQVLFEYVQRIYKETGAYHSEREQALSLLAARKSAVEASLSQAERELQEKQSLIFEQLEDSLAGVTNELAQLKSSKGRLCSLETRMEQYAKEIALMNQELDPLEKTVARARNEKAAGEQERGSFLKKLEKAEKKASSYATKRDGQLANIYNQIFEIGDHIQKLEKELPGKRADVQHYLDAWLLETVKKLVKKDDMYLLLKEMQAEEEVVKLAQYVKAEYRALKERFREELEILDAKGQLPITTFNFPEHFEDKELSIDELGKEVEETLLVEVILQPKHWYPPSDPLILKEWESSWQEVYVPVHFERRGYGLARRLVQAIEKALPAEAEIFPSEYKEVLHLEVRMEYEALRNTLLNLQPEEFEEAGVSYHLIDVKKMLQEGMEEREKGLRRWLRRH